MSDSLDEADDQPAWSVMVGAATRALKESGFDLKRVPGRGRANVWEIAQGGKSKRASIRTSKDRWFAFPPLKRGTKWKTLDTVDVVIVAVVDDPQDPRSIEVYLFDAPDVQKRFDASYAARIKAGMTVRDNFGMWVGLDEDSRGLPASVGSGLAAKHKPLGVYRIEDLTARIAAKDSMQPELPRAEATFQQGTIAEVLDWARKRIASLSGVAAQSVKLDLKIEY
ncbi:MAG: hypothetical protein ACREVI_13610 [Steroidobacteraceae bacterium]